MKKKILMVDDTAFMRQFFKNCLEKDSEYFVTEAEDGESGFEIYSRESFDLVITDFSMGEGRMNGFEFIRKLKGTFGEQCAPIILLTLEKAFDKENLPPDIKGYLFEFVSKTGGIKEFKAIVARAFAQ